MIDFSKPNYIYITKIFSCGQITSHMNVRLGSGLAIDLSP